MVKNPEILEQVELQHEREHPLTLEQKFALFEDMYQHAVKLRGVEFNNTEEHLESIIFLAKALHGNTSTASRAHR